MPLYDLVCKCGFKTEEIVYEIPLCPKCGRGLQIDYSKLTNQMMKMKGEGGFPARRKFFKGTAPFSKARPWSLEHPKFDAPSLGSNIREGSE